MKKWICLGLLFVTLPGWALAREEAATGTLTGFVLSTANGNLLPGVSVLIEPGGVQEKTDLDGMFNVALAPGEYELKLTLEGYVSQTVRGIKIEAGKETPQDIPLSPVSGVTSETIEVVAEAEKASSVALLSERRSSPVLTDSIGRQEMSKSSGSDAADLVQRVTGVSIVDNKFVYVRGLGERYSASSLNGSQIPSTQPDKKVVPMDLFPTGLLENIRTEKSYTPDQPGEFAGGVVHINTIDFPRTRQLKVSYGMGFGTNTTFKDFQRYPGGGLGFWGFDDGRRALPSLIPGVRVTPLNRFTGAGFTPEQLQEFGRAFDNTWEFDADQTAPVNQKFSFVAGDTFGNLGVVLGANHDIGYHNQLERQTFFNVGADDLETFSDYDMSFSTISTRTSGTANLGYRFNDLNRVVFRNFYTHTSSDEARFFEGFNRDLNSDFRNLRLLFAEEGIYSGQLIGEHSIQSLGNLLLEWGLSRSRSTYDRPDHRESLYELRRGVFSLADESQSGFRQFSHLAEQIWEPSIALSSFFYGSGVVASIKVGASYRDRSRDFTNRRFRFIPVNNRGMDLTQDPEDILVPENIRPDGFELREETRNTDTYEATQINRSVYAMGDVAFGNWRFVFGARVEADSQRVTTFDLFNRDAQSVDSLLETTDLLPAVNVIYRLSTTQNLRGSFSKTLNRPEFRELAPFDFTDVVGGRTILGNSDLKRARIQNYDLRWEWFPTPEELVSASFFYKNFDDPIEKVVLPSAQLQTSFDNVDQARNFGFELDFRRGLSILSSKLANFAVSANYTYVESNVEIGDIALNVLTSLSRPLEGQSGNLANAIFEYRNSGRQTVARLLYSFQGSRIAEVGALGLPDLIEQSYNRLDAVFLQSFGPGKKWGLKVSAENLLDESVEYKLQDKFHRVFKTGRKFGITLSYSFFDR